VYTSNLRTPSYHPSRANARPAFTDKGKLVLPLRGWQLERHLAKHHPEGNEEALHFHRRAAKYVLPPGSYGKRLDVPMPQRVLDAERVFFVIEGSLKTDAVLSQGEAAFGVPSVTLWDAPELTEFIRVMRLAEKEVVIVPDADWFTNEMVVMQAMLCRTYLRDRGVNAIVAAPPLQAGAVMVDSVFGPLKGVDDYLRAGYSLDSMTVLEREPCDRAVAWKAMREHVTHAGALRRDVRAVTTLPLYATGDGQLVKSIKGFAQILSCDRKTARKAIVDLYAAGVIDIEGSLDADFQYEDPLEKTWHDYDWREQPRITFASEFRATERLRRLRERPTILTSSNTEMTIVEQAAC
jgi:hypothetical protein